MTTSSSSAPSQPMTRSEWVSTLPPWRRLLATFNWRPVYDIEQRTKQHELSELESEKRLQQLKIETEQIRNEAEQIEKETEQLRQENKRLAGLNSRMDALLRNADSSSQIPPATDSN
jgi:TolA-binding protein